MQALLVFAPAVLNGILLVHMLWPERTLAGLSFKLFLGAGIGAGLQSLLYFGYLLILPAQNAFLYINLLFLAVLLVITVRRERLRDQEARLAPFPPSLAAPQRLWVLVGLMVFLVSLTTTGNYLLRRRQGDWDAWMMYNRAARFLHIDQAHWRDSFSPRMDPIFHADYPLLLAANIAAGWEMLGSESAGVPMLQSALFSIACVGLLASALASCKSIGQAALGLTLLWGLPVFVNEGARQMADIPMAFFLLATGVLLYLYANRGDLGLVALAGVTTGLAAWTKNEGAVLVVGTGAALLVLLSRQFSWRPIVWLTAGISGPLAALVFFRLRLAPSGDILSAAAGGSLRQISDPARHSMILGYLGSELTGFGSWGILGLGVGVLPVLAVYYGLFRARVAGQVRPAFAAGFIILGVQLLGYYAAYLISPYDLAWHLSYSSTRVILQIFPLLLFLVLCASKEAEAVLRPGLRPTAE